MDISGFFIKHAALRSKSKDWLALNQDIVSKWSDMSTYGLFSVSVSVLFQYKADLILISLKYNLFSSWYGWKIAHLALNNNHLLICWGLDPDLWCYQKSITFTTQLSRLPKSLRC
jgi:hypothetical protein